MTKYLIAGVVLFSVLFSCMIYRNIGGEKKYSKGYEEKKFDIDENGDTVYYVGVNMDTSTIKLDTIKTQ